MRAYNLKKPYIISSLVVLLIDLFGPYIYKSMSWKGALYYLVCSVLFLFGLSLKNVGMCSRRFYVLAEPQKIILSRKGVVFVCFFSILSLLSMATYLFILYRNAGSMWMVGREDVRYLMTNVRGPLTRALELLMWCSTPSYLLSTNSNNNFTKLQKSLFFISFWATPLFYLLLGARFSLFYHLIVFLVDKRMRSSKKRTITVQNKKVFFVFLGFIILGCLLIIVYRLFANRGNTNIYVQKLNYEGDMVIRYFWEKLFRLSNNSLSPIFKIFYYFGHSIPNLCYLLSKSNISLEHTYGLVFFTVIRYVLILFGHSDAWVKDIILSYPGAGYYKTYLSVLILDFGVLLTPLTCVLIGFLFSRIERYAISNIIARSIYPIAWACMISAPLVDIWVDSSQMDIVILLSFGVVFWLFKGFIYTTEASEGEGSMEKLSV